MSFKYFKELCDKANKEMEEAREELRKERNKSDEEYDKFQEELKQEKENMTFKILKPFFTLLTGEVIPLVKLSYAFTEQGIEFLIRDGYIEKIDINQYKVGEYIKFRCKDAEICGEIIRYSHEYGREPSNRLIVITENHDKYVVSYDMILCRMKQHKVWINVYRDKGRIITSTYGFDNEVWAREAIMENNWEEFIGTQQITILEEDTKPIKEDEK